MDFQLFFEESPDVLLVLLPDSPRFTAVAATKARLASTGSTLEETIGRGLFELFPDNPDDATANATANLRASLERVLATRAADTMAVQKYDIPLPDGGFEARYWSPRNIPILSAAGAIRYILHRAVDVTDIARADEAGQELRGRTRDMEREVLQRSRELDAANRRLRDANKKLSELDAAKTAFFSNISHEFRTPLTLMLGPLEEALADDDPSLDATHRGRLQLAHANALRLLKMVNALLDFSRLEAGRLGGTFAPVDLASATANLAGMFQAAFDRAGLQLVLDCPRLSEPVWIDRDLWEKVIPNLVSNAFKFTWSGSVTVRVDELPERAVVEVIDTGTGIAAAELPRIFERFHRVEGAVGRTHEGAGIGLALVRELVELHGGRLSATSTPGAGSTFRIEIPKGFAHLREESVLHSAVDARTDPYEPAGYTSAPQAHVVEAARGIEPPSAAREGAMPDLGSDRTRKGPRAQILVVDDNADLRRYIASLLVPYYEVVTANDGREALDMIRVRAPDLVLSDVMMPRLTGVELVREMRAAPATVVVPVILLSARAGEGSTIEGLDAGADDYLTKPFTAQELLARVRSHVHLAQARRKLVADLETANRELDSFSYSVAHDLRGPLRSIDGFSALLLEEDALGLTEEGRRRLDIVRGAAQRMSRLIDDLLHLARINRGEPQRVVFDLSSLVVTVASSLQEGAHGRSVELSVEPGVQVEADPHLLQIVLENLLGNAWKFTARRAQARVEFGSLELNGQCCYFVRDNGAGFDMNYAAKLFGVFQRLHPDAEFQGTGIGLATVKRIVARHGGRVWGEGKPGHGATFYFTLEAAGSSPPAVARHCATV